MIFHLKYKKMPELIWKTIYLIIQELVYLLQGLGKSMYFTFESAETKVSNRQTQYFTGKCSSHASRKNPSIPAGMEQSRGWQVSQSGRVSSA